jgi:hypothetical protein
MVGIGGCTTAPPPSPQLLAECTRLFVLWARYEQHWTFHHTGQRVRAELALDSCEHGRYDEGIAELKRLLRRGGFTLAD